MTAYYFDVTQRLRAQRKKRSILVPVPVPEIQLNDLDTSGQYPVRYTETWSSEVTIDNAIDGHIYEGCAEGRQDMDVVMDLAAV